MPASLQLSIPTPIEVLPPSRRIVVGAVVGVLALVLVVGGGLFATWCFGGLGSASPGPHARIFVLVERNQAETEANDERAIRTDDVLHVAVTGDPGAYTTLLNLDSDHRFSRLESTWDSVLGPDRAPLSRKFRADDETGHEQLVLIAARHPIGNPDAVLRAVNDQRGLTRQERIESLRAHLDAAFGAGETALYTSQDLLHRR